MRGTSTPVILYFKSSNKSKNPEHLLLQTRLHRRLGTQQVQWCLRGISKDWISKEFFQSRVNIVRSRLIVDIWLVHMQPLTSSKTKLLQRVFKLRMSLGNKMFPSLTVSPGVKCTNFKD